MYPHGHFYSPIASKKDIQEFKSIIWEGNNSNSINGIDLNIDYQIQLLKSFEQYYKEMPFKFEKPKEHRYCFNNSSYEYTDAIMLYSFIRHFKPKNIIEIGSGFSSAVMLDTRDIFNMKIGISFIEPYPKLLYSLLRENDLDSCKIFDTKVQNVSLQEFSKLKENDILFIDSSHVSKTGSDVNFEIFNILPNLNSGVIIHFHDVFYPFEYPKEWVLEGRNWNEDYLLRAFLSYNNAFEILLFSQFIHKYYKIAFENMPLTHKNTGRNLWLRKK
jgi:predicted O-methyltransferase YrrM